MRLSPAHAILQSRVGRRLLATFFVLVAVPVGAVSLLAYQFIEYVGQKSAASGAMRSNYLVSDDQGKLM